MAKTLPAEFGQQLGIANLLDQGADAVRDTSERVTRRNARDRRLRCRASQGFGPIGHSCRCGFRCLESVLIQTRSRGRTEDRGRQCRPDAADRITVQKPAVPSFNFEAISGDLGKTFGNLTKSISGISDEASAREALPQITELQKQFQGYGFDKLPQASDIDSRSDAESDGGKAASCP